MHPFPAAMLMQSGGAAAPIYVQETTQSLPVMTSNTAPTGHTAAASSVGSYDPYYAFNGTTTLGGNCWTNNPSTDPAPGPWIQRTVPSPIRVYAYTVYADSQGQCPTALDLLGSKDGTNFNTLDSRTVAWTSSGQAQTFTVPQGKRDSYSTYRVVAKANGSDGGIGVSYQEIQFLQETVRATLWSATDKSANITVSNGNRTATPNATGAAAIRATNQSRATSQGDATAGRYYFEVTAGGTATGRMAVGLSSPGRALNSLPTTSADTTAAYWNSSTGISFNGALVTSATFTVGDVIGVLLDTVASPNTVQFYKNGAAVGSAISLSGSLAAGQAVYPLAGFQGGTVYTATANFGASAFTASLTSLNASAWI